MGASLRRLYEQGRDIDGAGINCSIAVHADVDGRATDIALGWAVALGAPFIFETTLESEYRSDIVGERAILLGIPHAIAEAVYRRCRELGDDPLERSSARPNRMTGPLARAISRGGVRAVLDGFRGDDRRTFDDAYCATLPRDSRRSSKSCTTTSVRATRSPAFVSPHGGSNAIRWPTSTAAACGPSATRSAERRDEIDVTIDPLTAGIFCGAMIAQVDTFDDGRALVVRDRQRVGHRARRLAHPVHARRAASPT